MPLVLADRVNETTTTTSTGTVTLAGAVSGYQSFAVIGNANTTYYTIVHQTASEWEVGIGTYTSSGTTLSRDTVLSSSNGGSLVNFSAGTKFVFCDYPAGRAVYLDTATNVTIPGLTLSGNLTFSSTAQRITADMSNATVSNRFAFQNSVANAQSIVNVLPNGTGTVSQLQLFNNSTPTNGSFAGLFVNASESRLQSGTQGSGTYLPLTFFTNGSEQARLDTSGNLGIGTTSPTQKLDVNGGAAVTGTTPLFLQRAVIPSFDGQGAPALDWQFYSTGTTYTVGARIQGLADDAWSSTSAPTSLRFYTAPSGSTSISERMRISNAGNVGIGTTSPANYTNYRNLAISGTTGGNIDMLSGSTKVGNLFNDGTNFYAYNVIAGSLVFGTNNTERARITSGGDLLVGRTGTDGFTSASTYISKGLSVEWGEDRYIGMPYLTGSEYFNGMVLDASGRRTDIQAKAADGTSKITFSTGSTPSERARIDSSGNLGIGTSSPSAKLSVSSGNIFVDNANGSVIVRNADLTNQQQIRLRMSGTDGVLDTTRAAGTAANLIFGTEGVERMRLDSSGNLLVGTTAGGAAGIAMPTSFNYSFSEGSSNSYANFFRQVNTAAAVLAHGYKRSATSGFASSIGVSVARAAIAVGYDNGAISFFSDTATNVANGTDVTPTERMRLTSGGNLLLGTTTAAYSGTLLNIGSTSDSQNGVQIQTSATGNGYVLFGDGSGAAAYTGQIRYFHLDNFMSFHTNGAEWLRINSSGNVGIGSTSPAAKLHVVNSTPNSGRPTVLLDANYGNTGDTAASLRATLNSNAGGTYLWGYTGESILAHNTEFISGSNWVARSTTASYLSQSGGIFTFFSNQSLTAGNTFTPSERMRLDTSGNLGIGSTAPAEALEISRTTDPKIRFVDVGNLDAKIGIVSSTALGFEVNGSERMRIASDGKVGIASTNPGVDLQIGSDTSTTRALSVRYSSVPLYLSGGFDGTNALNTFSANAYANATGSGQSWTSFSNTSYAASAVQLASSTTGADIRFLTAAAANTNPTERARITSGGDLLVGTTNTSATAGEGFKSVFPIAAVPSVRSVGNNSTSSYSTYEVYSTSAAAYRFYVDYAGTVFATTTTISAISDQRFKENVQDIDVGLNAVMALKPRKFDWKAGKGKDIKNDRGFIAQEFEQVFPDLIDEWKDPAPEGEEPYKSVRQDLIPVLVKAIQELTARVAQLETK